MKLTYLYFAVLFFFISCYGQESTDLSKIDTSKVKKITITNKMYCTQQKLKPNGIIIKDRNQIKKIIEAFSYSEKEKRRKGDIDVKNNTGFFDISFNEGDKLYFYSVIYTTYNGVILMNNNNGDMYKNDRLEGVIYLLFVESPDGL